MKNIGTILLASVAMIGCGGTDDGNGNTNEVPPVESGYTRFVMPTVSDIQPGSDVIWCQYISAPFDQDTDIVDFEGWQSTGGHHLVLYATSMTLPPGTSRLCTDEDMLAITYVGGIGGEGVGAVVKSLPPGATLRIPKGQALMANTHFVNTSSAPISGNGYVDMKLRPADPAAITMAMFVNMSPNITVPPHQEAAVDANCTIQQDLTINIFGNHMHGYGKSIYTEVLRKGGTTESLLKNDVWVPEMEFNPTLASWTVDKPLQLHVGDTVHTHCEWNNSTASEVSFPKEMCVAFGFYVGNGQIVCSDGVWGK